MGEIHVLHVLNSAHGGSALSTFELIDALGRKGIVSSLVCFNNATEEQQKKIRERVGGSVMFIPLYWTNKKIRTAFWKRPILECLSLIRTWRGHKYQNAIRSIIQRNGINVVHTSTILNPEGAIAAKRNNLPHVWHVRELIGPDKHFHFYNYEAWAQFVLNHCAFLIANSSVTEKCLWKFFPRDRVLNIPNGIALEDFTVKQHSNGGRLVVGMIGSITTRWKNHEFFVRTAALFGAKHDVEFRIYGSLPATNDPYLIFLKNLVDQLKAGNTVQFIPFAKPEDIIREIDIMFHPSQFESFGRIFVEAMAGGIPVVAVNEGGPLEMVQEGINGYLVEKNDPGGAAEKLNFLIEDPARRNAFGEKGRHLVEQKYTLDRLAVDIIRLYETVMKS